MKNISKNLSYENSLRERNRLSRLERKIDEIADFEDYFLRARSRKHDVGKWKINQNKINFNLCINPNGAGGAMSPHFFQMAISPWKKGSGCSKFLDFS